MLGKNNYDTCKFLRIIKGDSRDFCVTRINKFFANYSSIRTNVKTYLR